MSKGKGKQVDKDREGASAPGASITLAEISALHDDLRASITADFKTSFKSLATKLDSIQSTVADHDFRIGNLESATTEISQQLKQVEATCSRLQKDNEWLKAKVSDLESRSRRQNIRILGLPWEYKSRRKYCRRPTGARMDPRFTQKTVKFGGRKIMVWGYIQYGGVREICRVEGNINSLKYQEILATSYIPNHKRGQILQQDGAPSHTSISTSEFLKAKKIKMLQDWPAQSPDMNIIKHMWGRMKEEAWKTKPKNIDELWEACKTAFFAIPDDFINKLYESLPNRMDAVLQAHGSHTRY
ncbi:hypothetical protein F2P79_018097 [Pimephales promelas]|nr:hypothetical protein F2P79_018096 [Pimephales promelas]KAG1937638.1 hypothetical protein F2P79_018097 [Pimephales promelas]